MGCILKKMNECLFVGSYKPLGVFLSLFFEPGNIKTFPKVKSLTRMIHIRGVETLW